jgi:hypothetical protein
VRQSSVDAFHDDFPLELRKANKHLHHHATGSGLSFDCFTQAAKRCARSICLRIVSRMESLIHLICMPLWYAVCPILGFFYDQQKTGKAIFVDVNGEQKYGVYQADGTIRVSFWQEDGTTIYKSLNQDGSWVEES